MLTLEMQKALEIRGIDSGRWMIDKKLEAPQEYNATCGMSYEKWRDEVYIPREYRRITGRPAKREGQGRLVIDGNNENVMRIEE